MVGWGGGCLPPSQESGRSNRRSLWHRLFSGPAPHKTRHAAREAAIIWSTSSCKALHTLAHFTWVIAVGVLAGDTQVVTSTASGVLTIWNAACGQKLKSLSKRRSGHPLAPIRTSSYGLLAPLRSGGGARVTSHRSRRSSRSADNSKSTPRRGSSIAGKHAVRGGCFPGLRGQRQGPQAKWAARAIANTIKW